MLAIVGQLPPARQVPQRATPARKPSRSMQKGSQPLPYLAARRIACRRVARDPDGRPAVGRARQHAGRVEAVEPAVVAGDRLAPQRLQDLDRFVGHRGAAGEVGAQQGELRRPPADPHAEDEAPPREQVEGRGLLGHQDGVALRQDQDGGAELRRGTRCTRVARVTSGSMTCPPSRYADRRRSLIT